MANQKLRQLKENLQKGFYLQNLYEMISLCKDLAESNEIPIPFYFLKNVFKDITDGWEGEALPADKADVTQDFLIPEINNLLKLIDEQASKEALFDAMNDISSICAKF